jgi:ABC-type cobalamin transport system permease subunit
MDSRLPAVAALLIGAALAVVGAAEYVRPGLDVPPYDPLATGLFVVGTGLALVVAGAVAASQRLDHLALRLAAGIGLLTLALAVFSPDSLRFGGVFWLGMVFFALVAAGAYRTVSHADF